METSPEKRKVCELKAHPRQHDFFVDTPDVAIDADGIFRNQVFEFGPAVPVAVIKNRFASVNLRIRPEMSFQFFPLKRSYT